MDSNQRITAHIAGGKAMLAFSLGKFIVPTTFIGFETATSPILNRYSSTIELPAMRSLVKNETNPLVTIFSKGWHFIPQLDLPIRLYFCCFVQFLNYA